MNSIHQNKNESGPFEINGLLDGGQYIPQVFDNKSERRCEFKKLGFKQFWARFMVLTGNS